MSLVSPTIVNDAINNVKIQQSIPVGCDPLSCTNCMWFNSHQVSALSGLEVNKIEQASSDGHQMSLVMVTRVTRDPSPEENDRHQ